MGKSTPAQLARAREYYINNKETILASRKIWRAENPDKVAEIEKQYRKEHRAGWILIRAKSRAKKNGLKCTITEDDIILVDVCPLLGINLVYGNDTTKDDSASIDRIDSNKGYIPGNVWVISWRANNLKSNATIEELEMLSTNLRKRLKVVV
jgi:hypothetical protein